MKLFGYLKSIGSGFNRSLWILAFLLNGVSIWLFPAFPTVDGSTHSLTSKLILDQILGQADPNISVGSYWVPNALGHYALVALQFVLSPTIAERTLLFLILCGMGIGLFRICQALGNSKPWATLLALPFGYSFLLTMGFYNFLLGLTIALFILAYLFKEGLAHGKQWLVFLAGSLIVLWCHAMAFFFLALVTTVYGLHIYLAGATRKKPNKAALYSLLRMSAVLLPGTVLFFMFTTGQDTQWGTADADKALKELIDLRILVLYSFELERPYVLFFTSMLALLGIRTMMQVLSGGLGGMFERPSTFLLLTSFLLLGLYFVLPDSTGYASFISLRLQLMVMVLLIAWAAVELPFGRWPGALVVIILAVHITRLDYMRDLMAPHSAKESAIAQASRVMPAHTNVLPINFEPDWMFGHQAAGLGLFNDLYIVENYECSVGYFPLVWRKNLPSPLYWHLMTATDKQCFDWLKDYVDAKETPSMDQIALIGPVDSTSCKAQNVLPILKAHYHRTFDNGYVQIFTLKR